MSQNSPLPGVEPGRGGLMDHVAVATYQPLTRDSLLFGPTVWPQGRLS